jgi:hypothetical protein
MVLSNGELVVMTISLHDISNVSAENDELRFLVGEQNWILTMRDAQEWSNALHTALVITQEQ